MSGEDGAAGEERRPAREHHEWHVARAWRSLTKDHPLRRSADAFTLAVLDDVREVVGCWADEWCGARWSSFLNRKSFLHEVEEAITPLAALCRRVDRDAAAGATAAVVVVDVACGKGFFSMLLSSLGARRPLLRDRIKRVVLVEKANVDFSHVLLLDESSNTIPLEVWERTNVFDDALLLRLRALEEEAGNAALWLVGIHLCRRLSSRCVELANVLDVSFLALAPCCLPRWRGTCSEPVVVLQEARSLAEMRAQGARAKAAVKERDATWRTSCWKCGEPGHLKPDCPATTEITALRAARKRRETGLLEGPTASVMSLDLTTLGATGEEEAPGVKKPFAAWAQFLCSALRERQGATVTVFEAELGSSSGQSHHSSGPTHGGKAAGAAAVVVRTGVADRKVWWLLLS